ncbi:MAG TPA: SEC-C domain-containing protein [Pyrinomonadaceae bacterium]|jgi:hypothetical protein
MIVGTPNRITSEIRSFCNRIVENSSPFHLPVEPDRKSIKLECFPNVENFISKNGGAIQYGWRIGEWYEIMLEAEFHAVWRAPNGDFRDVTPSGEKRILFLPDDTGIYEGRQIPNVRLALSKSRLVHEFIDIQGKLFEAMNEGELAEKHGAISLPAHKISPLMDRSRHLFIQIYKSTATKNSECYCGSGKKYKKCHMSSV